jgi:mono/diheme cytochrome c family protein
VLIDIDIVNVINNLRYFEQVLLGGSYKMRLFIALVFTVLISGSLVAQTPANAKAMKNPVASDAKSIEAGKALYVKNCVSCHGPAGKGDGAIVKSLKADAPKPSDLTDAKWDHGSTDGEIFVVLRDGLPAPSMMKGQKAKLMDNDMWNLVNYLKSLAPKK